MKTTNVFDCKIKNIPKKKHEEYFFYYIKNNINIPFNVKRIYYLYNVPNNQNRGGHAHFKLEQYIVVVQGSCDIILDDGNNKRTVTLNNPNIALHIIPGLWRELTNFTSETVVIVLASEIYNESDYIREYSDFLDYKKYR